MSRTVYGVFILADECVNPPDGGCVCFCDLESCVTYCAEPVWTGEHANMVALTISEADYDEDCNDTFYGCMNFETRQWQVEIPDKCCCIITGVSGENCPYIKLDINNVSVSGCLMAGALKWDGAINKTLLLPYGGIADSSPFWRLYISPSGGGLFSVGTQTEYPVYSNCVGELCSCPGHVYEIVWWKGALEIKVTGEEDCGGVITVFHGHPVASCFDDPLEVINEVENGSGTVTMTFCVEIVVISGYVTKEDIGVEDVLMDGFPIAVMTDEDGYYECAVVSGWSGTVTPSKICCTFDPTYIEYVDVTTDQANQNYEADCVSTPSPPAWDVEPYETSSSPNCKANMSATDYSSIDPAVKYYFECYDVPTVNSGWTANREWNNVPIGYCGQGLCFRFKVDACGSISDWSSTECLPT